MPDPCWQDGTTTLYTGNAHDVLAELPDHTADCIIASPPAWGLEGEAIPELQGHEPTPAAYVTALRRVFAEAYRVLAADGTLWLNLRDRYTDGRALGERAPGRHARRRTSGSGPSAPSLTGLPWQVAFALHDDGWIIRNAIVWHDLNAVIPPTANRFAATYQLLFLLARQKHHWFDHDPIREALSGSASGREGAPHTPGGTARRLYGTRQDVAEGDHAARCARRRKPEAAASGKQHAAHSTGTTAGDIWAASSSPDSSGITELPIGIPLRAIAVGCRPGGTVLDPFHQAGPTGIAARRSGRAFIGIESSAASCERARTRLLNSSSGLGGSAI